MDSIEAHRSQATGQVAVRTLHPDDLEELARSLPAWSSDQYPLRLAAQDRGELVQLVAWKDGVPVGRAMLLFPEHEEYSESAERWDCAEVRDVFVHPWHRRRGAATALMREAEDVAGRRGLRRVGLTVTLDEEDERARLLYAGLGYHRAHGPFIAGATLDGDDGVTQHHAHVMVYLTKELA